MQGDSLQDQTIRPADGIQPWSRKLLERALPGYEIGEVLGRGAHGFVVVARHRQLRRDVAVKQLAPSLRFDQTMRARFESEARLLASLDHPHIVRIYDFLEVEDAYLLVMERLAGGTARSRLGPAGLPPQEACAILLAVCGALHYAHGKGMLHRDIKPENLLFSDTNVLKVADFGVAKVLSGSAGTLTQTGAVVGTPSYIAPEQIEGRPLGPHTDVYAAGTVLYELLCGTLPFPGTGDLMEALRQRTQQAPVPLRERAPAVPTEVADVTACALQADPAARYATAGELAAALEHAATSAWGPDWESAGGVVVHSLAKASSPRSVAPPPSSRSVTPSPPSSPSARSVTPPPPSPRSVTPPPPARAPTEQPSRPQPSAPRPAIAGRAAELERLQRALVSVDEGRRGAAVAVLGEPGIGKTRLLEEVRTRARDRGHVVLAGRADDFERDLPFGVFIDAIDEHLAALDPPRVQHFAAPDLGAELAHIFPALAMLAGERAPVLQDERYRAHRAVRRLLERLAEEKPLLLVLDDLHAADTASIELTAALLRRPPNAPVLLAVALRPKKTPPRLAAVLRDAARDGAIERIELGPLSQTDARDLLGAEISPAVGAALYRESGGNPFYLDQLVKGAARGEGAAAGAPADEADPVTAAVRSAGIPAAVAAAIAEEVAALPVGTRTLLDGASVAGDPFEPDLAAAAADVPEPEALAALDDLLALDVVHRTDAPRRFRFRHPLVRRAVYSVAPAGWRLGAHERVARALEARGASLVARAHHVEQFARPGDETAIALLTQAGHAAAARAPASAAHWFGAALRLLPERDPDAASQDGGRRHEDLLAALATSLAAAGLLTESHRALLELLDRLPAGAVARRVSLTVECATVEHLLGRHQEARARLIATLDEVPDPASPEAVALMIELAMDGFYSMDYEWMWDTAERALATAARLGNRPLAAAADAVLASGAAMAGHIAEARSRADEAATAVNALADLELATRLDAASQLGWAEFYLERYDDSIAHLRRGMAVARATGRGQRLPVMMEGLACSLFMRGRLAEAAELQDGSVESARLSANPQRLCWALFNRAWTARLAGDIELALRLAKESVERSSAIDHGIVPALARAVHGVVLLETDALARGADELLAAAGGPDLPLIPRPRKCVYYEPLTRAELRRHRLREAADFAQRAETAAAGLDLRVPVALARRAQAAVAMATGDARAAADAALESAAAAEEVGARIEAARSRTLAGAALGLAGQRTQAVVELRAAAGELDACGALGYRDEARRELRRVGGPDPGITSA